MEAYIGAIFVDSEYDYKEVERFFEVHIRWFFEDMSIYDSFANNHPTVSSPKFFFPSVIYFLSAKIFFKKKTDTTPLPLKYGIQMRAPSPHGP